MQTLSPEHCWPQIKHLGMGLMHKSRWSITQVYNGQLTLLTETLTQRESSKDTFFFHCAQRYAVWEAAYHLWCKVTAKWPTQQCVLPIMNQTAFQFGHIYIYIFFSCPIYVWTVFNYIIYLYVSWLRHTAGLINQCQGQMSRDKCPGTNVQGRICSSSGTNVQGHLFSVPLAPLHIYWMMLVAANILRNYRET